MEIKEHKPHWFDPSDKLLGREPNYYEPIMLGDFDPKGSGIKELEDWAKQKKCCEN